MSKICKTLNVVVDIVMTKRMSYKMSITIKKIGKRPNLQNYLRLLTFGCLIQETEIYNFHKKVFLKYVISIIISSC